ncbi:MAG: RNA-directed DNA polymerase, partial [Gammaproteobacteria bacterium]|nr:RNA-directed DNA polymerase [Gammaproteobacteria bacterium]
MIRDKIDHEIQSMLDMGIIQDSLSDWASPIVAVTKSDGSIRICVDFRRVNEVTRSFEFPLPCTDEILEKIGLSMGRQTKYENRPCISMFDLKMGYHQLQIKPEDRHKTAFRTHRGLYEYTRLPMGLKTAGSFFQRLMNKVFNGVLDEGIFCYLDDVCIATSSIEDHLEKLVEVLTRLRGALLKLKPKKCILLTDEAKYLGHIVTREGLKPDPGKTECIATYPVPRNLTEMRRFIGMASYYRKFIQGFAAISHPLRKLTEKGVFFEWSPACQEAFEELKGRLIRSPLLHYPDVTKGHYFLETDGSNLGLG